MLLRPYQQDAVTAIRKEFESQQRTMCVMATGLGKTIVFSHIANEWTHGRVMVIAHLDELIGQAARKLCAVTGEWPAIEQGSEFANEGSMHGRSQFVVASVQSLHKNRLTQDRFNDVSLLVIDEGHRAHEASKLYGQVVRKLEAKNPNLRTLLVTATPVRHDGKKLLCDSYAYTYTLRPAVDDAWLVGLRNQIAIVSGLDFSGVDSAGKDLNQAQLAQVLEQEGPLHKMAATIVDAAGSDKTLIFCASVKQAEDLAKVLNRYQPRSAIWLCGDQQVCPKAYRREQLKRYSEDEFQYLLNMGCLIEGYDEPSIKLLVMGQPTLSTPRAMQMIGRGTRPLDGVLDSQMNCDQRRAAIAASDKPYIRVLDFVDQSRRHHFVTACDPGILGGAYSDAVVEQAKAKIEEKSAGGKMVDVDDELRAADRMIREEEERRREEQRQHVVATSDYRLVDVDPFDPLSAGAGLDVAVKSGKPLSEKQVKLLEKFGINPERISRRQFQGIVVQIKNGQLRPKRRSESAPAGAVAGKLASGEQGTGQHAPAIGREQAAGDCTVQQQRVLKRYGLPTNVSQGEAARIIREQVNPSLRMGA